MVAMGDRLPPVIGEKSARLLQATLGMTTVGDLLLHAPRRYASRGERTDLSRLQADVDVTVVAEVKSATVRPMRQRRGSILDVVVSDGRSDLHLTFFNQKWREALMTPGRWGMFSGRVSVFRHQYQLTHPECVLLSDDEGAVDPEAAEAFANALIPIYPATAKLPSWRIAKTIGFVLGMLDPVPEIIPDATRADHALLGIDDALHQLHLPQSEGEWKAAARRLAWDEAFLLLAVMRRRRRIAATQQAQPRIPNGDLRARFDARLPFTLTDGQLAVGAEIAHDLAQAHPMRRLLQGEVGSGKTVVAVRAMLDVVDAGGQCVLLAPTEVLAQQHFATLSSLLGSLGRRGALDGDERGTELVLLTGSSSAGQRRAAESAMLSGSAGIVIGTHALLENRVQFRDLALVVIDEQHRFGVEQRAVIAAKAVGASEPHVLVMTATPIPRTATFTVFGDLDISTLHELPAGRAPIASHVVAADRPRFEARMWERVREEVAKGHQAYVVCPRIEAKDGKDESLPLASALEVAERLRHEELQGLSIGLLHGRMPPDDKAQAMARFALRGADGYDVLVATTVIEVGVDVPNASTMVVLDADRFGISQLHQLRGRVGRGSVPGLCFLQTRQPSDAPAVQRLVEVAGTNDGFELAQLDLLQRGEGDMLGTLQSGGKSGFRILSVLRDLELIQEASAAVDQVFSADPELVTHPELAAAIALREREAQEQYVDTA